MDKNKIYQNFFEQMNEALEWMMTEERPYVVAAYIEGAACAVSRMLECPAAMEAHLTPAIVANLTPEESAEFTKAWLRATEEKE